MNGPSSTVAGGWGRESSPQTEALGPEELNVYADVHIRYADVHIQTGICSKGFTKKGGERTERGGDLLFTAASWRDSTRVCPGSSGFGSTVPKESKVSDNAYDARRTWHLSPILEGPVGCPQAGSSHSGNGQVKRRKPGTWACLRAEE